MSLKMVGCMNWMFMWLVVFNLQRFVLMFVWLRVLYRILEFLIGMIWFCWLCRIKNGMFFFEMQVNGLVLVFSFGVFFGLVFSKLW